MIISASRRTDLPAFYMPWVLTRLEAGWCRVVNPFNPAQQRLVSLKPDEVDALVFWTRAPGRLAKALPRVRALGHERVAALVTLTGYGPRLEPHVPPAPSAIQAFRRLSAALGRPEALRWRYDPVLLLPGEGIDGHRRRFERLAGALEGATREVVVSFVDLYRKTLRRLAEPFRGSPDRARPDEDAATKLLADLAAMAAARGMTLQVCADELAGATPETPAGACIDSGWLASLFPERDVPGGKDPGQRALCGCAPSIDLGMPDTCLHGCRYCYAVRGHEVALARHARHDPGADALLPLARRGTPRPVGGVPPEAWSEVT